MTWFRSEELMEPRRSRTQRQGDHQEPASNSLGNTTPQETDQPPQTEISQSNGDDGALTGGGREGTAAPT